MYNLFSNFFLSKFFFEKFLPFLPNLCRVLNFKFEIFLIFKAKSSKSPGLATNPHLASKIKFFASPSILAISGPSGKGKTNFLDRLVGIVEPFNSEWDFETANNHLRFSGEDQLSEVRPFLSYCPQDVILFEGSLIDWGPLLPP